jgi:hypothetical protein
MSVCPAKRRGKHCASPLHYAAAVSAAAQRRLVDREGSTLNPDELFKTLQEWEQVLQTLPPPPEPGM